MNKDIAMNLAKLLSQLVCQKLKRQITVSNKIQTHSNYPATSCGASSLAHGGWWQTVGYRYNPGR